MKSICGRFLFIWSPIYDANINQGSIAVFEKSHKNLFINIHRTIKYGSSHVDKDILEKFQMNILKVRSGDAVILHSATIHGTYRLKERFCKINILDKDIVL